MGESDILQSSNSRIRIIEGVGRQTSVMELDTTFLSCVLDHELGDHGTSACELCVGCGYGSLGVLVIRSI